MSRSHLLGAALLVVIAAVVLWWWSGRPTVYEGAATVTLTDSRFEPKELHIRVGTAVTFKTTRPNQFWPASNLHPEHSMYPEFDPKEPIASGDSWTLTFTREGIWGYHDHLRSYFTGVIYVEE
ncbi:cupredoxin domain-containing protein [Candidatus Kaiserbacteria bacterium]|nr:cupredoxin domain-containing protein [Candidatus Kaiserbacteria bacterium]